MYEAFYGLTGKPFQLNPDPEFFFASRGVGIWISLACAVGIILAGLLEASEEL